MPNKSFEVPPSWRVVRSIDVHVAGEPLRVITAGFPEPRGATILAKRRHAKEHHDELRRALMLEPRGHADMYGCLLTEPVTADGDVGVLFMHNEGYSTMCGHGIIGLVKAGIEARLFTWASDEAIRIDTPAGRVTAKAEMSEGVVERVSFHNVASFVLELDVQVDVPGIGLVTTDIAYGGAFYAYVQAASVGVELAASNARQVIDVGMRIKRAVTAAYTLEHPDGDDDLNFLYGVIFVGPTAASNHSRNVCVFAEGEVDRSPTGTGVSGRAAIHHARGDLDVGEWITIESVIGTCFDVRVSALATVGGIVGVVPEVRGKAHFTGSHEFWIDPRDPLREGVFLR